MTKLILSFTLISALASAATFTGIITDSMCVADHKAMNMGPDPECVKACQKHGGGVKYVLWDGKKTYKLSDQATPEKFAAQKVKITGTLYEKTGIIKVEKMEAAR
ncbi:MAG: hypothetical protein NTY38_27880 [Acidobacteria bacterium]|nr:hypothetical protein [Acidobacteriota bacterium]